MSAWVMWGVAGLGLWGLIAATARWLMAPGLRGEDAIAGMLYRVFQGLAHGRHALRVEGAEHAAGFAERARAARRAGQAPSPGPLILIANHTAGIDPLLIQASLPFEVRWMMAQDMRAPVLEPLWSYARIIFVDRDKGDARALREAIRHVKEGGVLGLFPEGGIERPAERILPFAEGVGLIVARTGAPVLPVVVSGTPRVDPAWASLWRTSRSVIRFLPVVGFEGRAKRLGAEGIARELEGLFVEATGWPRNPNPPKLIDGRWWYARDDGTYEPS